MEPIDLEGGVGQEQLQLGEQGEVVGGNVGVGAAGDIVLNQPVGVQGAQDTQHVQVRLGVENVVNDTLKVKGVVGVRHQAVLIGALQLEAVSNPAIGRAVLAIAIKFGQTVAITKLLEVLVSAVYSTSTKVLHYTRVWQGVEVSAQHQGNGIGFSRDRRQLKTTGGLVHNVFHL